MFVQLNDFHFLKKDTEVKFFHLAIAIFLAVIYKSQSSQVSQNEW